MPMPGNEHRDDAIKLILLGIVRLQDSPDGLQTHLDCTPWEGV